MRHDRHHDIRDRPPAKLEAANRHLIQSSTTITSDSTHSPLGPSRQADAGLPPPPGSQWSKGGRRGGNDSTTSNSSSTTLGTGLAAAALHDHQPDPCLPRRRRGQHGGQQQWWWGRGRWWGGGGGWARRAAKGGRELRHVPCAPAAAGSGLVACLYMWSRAPIILIALLLIDLLTSSYASASCVYIGFTKRQAEVVVEIVVAGMEESTLRSTSLVRVLCMCGAC